MDFIKRHSVPIYFVLTFIISWSTIYILAGPDGIPATADQSVVLGMAMLLGPSLGFILLTALTSGQEGFRDIIAQLLRWKVEIRWYVVALLTAPLSTAAVLLPLSFISSDFTLNIFIKDDMAALILMGIVAGIMVAFFEELGWTGFAATPMKKRYGVIGSGVIIGVLWGLWHFLLFWESDSFSRTFPMVLLLAQLFSWAPAYRVLMIWVYDRTESLLITMLMHASLVAALVIMEPPLTGSELLTYILFRAAVLWVFVGVVTIFQRWNSVNTKIVKPIR